MTDPVPDSEDLRAGPPVSDALLALLPLVGRWRGEGVGVVARTGAEFRYGQELSFAHDGRPFLVYEARAWLLAEDGTLLRPAWRESGFWRPGAGPDDVEVVLASNTGQALVLAGAAGDTQWELETTSAHHSATAKDVGGERRLYAVRGEQLMYATELALPGEPFAPHLNAVLRRGTGG